MMTTSIYRLKYKNFFPLIAIADIFANNKSNKATNIHI
jgi:hypothetical protein